MEKWVAFLSHCRVTNKAVLFCFLAWDSVNILRKNRELFREPKASVLELPGGRHLRSSLPRPAKGENKNTAGLKSMFTDALTC